MSNPHLQLRNYRKPYQVTQSDVAYLLNLKNGSTICRCEKGERPISIDITLAYHLLFDTQLGSFFADHREHIKSRIVSRIRPLITTIQNERNDEKNQGRLLSLRNILIRLSQEGK